VCVGIELPTTTPISTDATWTKAVAMVIPSSTVRARNRVANVSAIICDLAPNSARKMMPVDKRRASTGTSYLPGQRTHRQRPTPAL
jgi:hypothetical protein